MTARRLSIGEAGVREQAGEAPRPRRGADRIGDEAGSAQELLRKRVPKRDERVGAIVERDHEHTPGAEHTVQLHQRSGGFVERVEVIERRSRDDGVE